MKIKAESHLTPLFPISLLVLVPSLAFGAGLAAIKEQSFHQDAGANIVVYSTFKDSGISVTIETATRTFTIQPKQLAGKIEVLSTLPVNITTDTELEPVRKAAKEYRDFSTRFPKSATVLTPHITALDSCIKEFEGGKARYNGEWVSKEEALAAKQKEEQSREESEAAIKRKDDQKRAFEESQKAKGLVKHKGEWFTKEDVRKLLENEAEAYKHWRKWQAYHTTIENERVELNNLRMKIPAEETQMYQNGMSKNVIKSAIEKRKRELDYVARKIDEKEDKLQWLSERIKSMIAAGSDEDSTNTIVERVMEGTIAIGMDREAVLAAWGKPDDVNKILSDGVDVEQWVYGRGFTNRQFVHINRGIVSSITQF
jgi:hypothetical protein